MSETFTWIFNTAGDPGSGKIPPNYLVRASVPSTHMALDNNSLSASAVTEARATALLLVGNSFLDAADRVGPGEHADRLRAAGLKLQGDAADLIQRSATPTRK
ncbi:MAG: hypothetical protein JSS13_12980 [Proteobacteria bacterium]|nr:hypothetical protein [Pseudomonadota bacterium]